MTLVRRRPLVALLTTLVLTGLMAVLAVAQTGGASPGASQSPDDLRRQIGTIIVTPGNGPSLAVADFQPRTAGIDQQVATFNMVLWSDLQFAGVSNLIGKSLYPTTRLADPASLRYEEWSGDPVKADYLAFGGLTDGANGQGFLYDIKTDRKSVV